MEITGAESTYLFIGPDDEPRQVVRVTIRAAGDEPQAAGTISIDGIGITTPEPVATPAMAADTSVVVEVGIRFADDLPIDGTVTAEAVLRRDGEERRHRFDAIVAEPGWRMFMVSHFHYDPVWWNTQAGYTETWGDDAAFRQPFQEPGLALVKAHLEMARRDADYRFVLAELDYLKPYWDVYPEDREYVRRLLADGRLELVGGTYNEPNTNLTSGETTIRNAVYGIGYQRDVLGGAPATAWQLDAFGHDPQFPGMMADAGLTSSSWARGPFHEWGPNWVRGSTRLPALETHVGEKPRMQFASEFDWVAPSGRALLTSYMANHYSAGWWLDASATLEEAEEEAYRLFTELRPLAATKNVLLPVGTDYTPPNKWVTEIHRDWARRYVWPRFVCAIPRDFFDAVRAERTAAGRGFSPQSRDMNPVYAGKDVSYIDTKQAQRAAENTLVDAEKFTTFAALLGARYPAEPIDKAWRQLVFGAHHDGITGSESDQVYIDLLAGWREALDIGTSVLQASLNWIGGAIDTSGDGRAVTVFNPLSWPRTDVARVDVGFGPGEAHGVALRDGEGGDVPFVVDRVDRHPDGSLASVSLRFVARDVPGVGYRTYRVAGAESPVADVGWRKVGGTSIETERFRVAVDPSAGGAIVEIRDLRTGKSVLRDGAFGNELLAYPEYPNHPRFGEGPWHLTPRGTVSSITDSTAEVRAEDSPVGRRLIVATEFEGCRVEQEIALWTDVERIEFVTVLDGFVGHDVLFRVRFGAEVEGGLPVSEVANAAIGRGFAFPNVDVAQVPYTLDNPALNWFELGAAACVHLVDAPGAAPRAARAIGVAEVVTPSAGAAYDETTSALVTALVRSGVTATVARADGSRYGTLALDSNLPDVRISIGSSEESPLTSAILEAADTGYRAELERQIAERGWGAVWVPAERGIRETWLPNPDLREPRQLPALIVAGSTVDGTLAATRWLADDLVDSVVEVRQPAALDGTTGRVEDYGVALLNRGTPGFAVEPDGSMYMSLLRSCTGWPSGVWIDPPRRTAPDGSSFQLQHFTHRFEYALLPHADDWRAAGVVQVGHDYNHPLIGRAFDTHAGDLPSTGALATVEPASAVLAALKPAGNPMSRMASSETRPEAGVTLRLYESAGRSTVARIDLVSSVHDAARSDLLEETRDPLEVHEETIEVALAPYEIATVVATVEPVAAGSSLRADGELVPSAEPAQPVFSDYWLHNKGAAPVGYQPVTVQIPPGVIVADGTFAVPIVVASERTDEPVAGSVEVAAPPGWEVTPGGRLYRLAPGAHLAMQALVTPPPETTPGRYFVAARIADGGQLHEDVVTVDYRRASDPPAPEPPRSRALARSIERATTRALLGDEAGGELAVRLMTNSLKVAVGERGSLQVALSNGAAAEIRGEAQIVAPHHVWPFVGPAAQGFSVPAGADHTIAFDVTPRPDAIPGSYWALVKVMYFGRRFYTETVALDVEPGPRARSIEVDRPTD